MNTYKRNLIKYLHTKKNIESSDRYLNILLHLRSDSIFFIYKLIIGYSRGRHKFIASNNIKSSKKTTQKIWKLQKSVAKIYQ